MEVVVGIDASRNRSGGARSHLCGIIEQANIAASGIAEVHIWSYSELLQSLPNLPWLIKHCPSQLQGSLADQLWWQYRHLPRELRSNGCNILLSTDAGSVCRFSPSVVMSRDMLSFESSEIQRYPWCTGSRIRLELLKVVQVDSLKRATGALFLTQYAATSLMEWTGPLPTSRIIPHGISESFRRKPIAESASPPKDAPFTFVYVSNADAYKHQWQVIKAASILRARGETFRLRLVGAATGPAAKKVSDAVKLADPEGQFIDVLPALAHKEIPDQLSLANAFIFASSCENMPNTLIEAMAHGLPVLCSDRGPMPEMLKDGGLYFNPEEPLSIAHTMQEALDNLEFRRASAMRAYELAAQYSWTRCAKETFDFLRDMAEVSQDMPSTK
jgi:glycosyltransferase involved in cell wall biosynthesis